MNRLIKSESQDETQNILQPVVQPANADSEVQVDINTNEECDDNKQMELDAHDEDDSVGDGESDNDVNDVEMRTIRNAHCEDLIVGDVCAEGRDLSYISIKQPCYQDDQARRMIPFAFPLPDTWCTKLLLIQHSFDDWLSKLTYEDKQELKEDNIKSGDIIAVARFSDSLADVSADMSMMMLNLLNNMALSIYGTARCLVCNELFTQMVRISG